MGVIKCPKCGGTHCMLTDNKSKRGLLWLILFGWIYLIVVFFKWMIGLALLVCVDWWMAIVKNKQGLGYVWMSKKYFSDSTKRYYCHDCGNNFVA